MKIVDGYHALGSVIESESASNDYKLKRQNEYIGIVEKLSKHAKTT